eukprot:1150973-Pelagomonas_calceolata.AAC.2
MESFHFLPPVAKVTAGCRSVQREIVKRLDLEQEVDALGIRIHLGEGMKIPLSSLDRALGQLCSQYLGQELLRGPTKPAPQMPYLAKSKNAHLVDDSLHTHQRAGRTQGAPAGRMPQTPGSTTLQIPAPRSRRGNS